ncbi:MAG: helix-turn-helix transcriptional regulator [Clostridia bacterium]|nr:helix-turn-helix transcriptional regulator [Clostridia bacterium]
MGNNERKHLEKYNKSDKFAVNEFIVFRTNQLNLRQADLANTTNIDKAIISKYFNKKRIPTDKDLRKLSKPLKVSEEVLLMLGGYIMPPKNQKRIIDELETIKKELNKYTENIKLQEKLEDANLKKYMHEEIKLNKKEKEFIQEYMEFIKYRRERGNK